MYEVCKQLGECNAVFCTYAPDDIKQGACYFLEPLTGAQWRPLVFDLTPEDFYDFVGDAH